MNIWSTLLLLPQALFDLGLFHSIETFFVFSYSMRFLAGCKGVNDVGLSVVPAKSVCGFGSTGQR